MIDPIDLLNRAVEVAPTPDKRDTDLSDWMRHYAAQAMAAYAAFRVVERNQPGPELGYLALLGEASTAALVALPGPAEAVPQALWDLTPEAGALNGEWMEFLADTLDVLGVNPADLYPWFDSDDFDAPLRLPVVEVAP